MPTQKNAVLVVEDEALVRMDIAQELADGGFDVIEATNAVEAIAILQTRAVNVVFTDVDMPGGVDGLELAKTVKERFPSIVVVVTSGHRIVTEHDLPAGATFTPKPYLPQRIVQLILKLAGEAITS